MGYETEQIRKQIEDNEAAIAYCERRMREEEDTTVLKNITEQLHERRERLESRLSQAESGTLDHNIQARQQPLI